MRNSCLLTITSLLLFICSSAQDEPCNAISLDCNVQAINGNFDDATFNPDILPTGCPGGQSSNSEGDIWFTFEADGEQGYLFYSDFNSQIPDHFVLLYTGPECNDLTKVRDCHIYESFHEAFPAGTYYAQVIPKSNSAQNNEYTAGLLCSPVPENDERCNATPVSCGNTYTGSFIGSSRTEFINCYCASGGGAESLDAGDVWFELDAVPGATYNIIGQDGQAIKIFETDGCTGDITQTSLCCNSQDILSFSGDGLYYISVRPEDLIARKKINYQITIECTTPPDNNLPCDAIEVSCDTGPITGTTVNAGSNVTICSGSFFQTPPMVWYKYISDFEGELELYLCSVAPTFNAIASVYRGNCDSLSCYDFGGGCISGPESFDVSPGETYYLAIHGFGGANEGEFTLTLQCEEEIFCPALDGFEGDPCDDGNILTENTVITADCECVGTPIPPGALCENAIPINDNSFFVDYFNPSEFIDPPYYYSFDDIPPFLDSLESDDVSFGCYQANGVVFSFTPNEDRFVDITVSDWVAVEPNITILTGCPFTTAHISKGCNDGEFTTKTVQNFYALADTTYYILIDGNPDVFGPFDVRFKMEVKLKKICPDLGVQFDPCDDGNPITQDDMINENCECAGTLKPGEFCETAVELPPTPGLTVSPLEVDEEDATFSGVDQCSGVGNSRDTWFYFDAVTTNMIVGAKSKFSGYDMVLEIYDECGESPIVCKDQKEDGKREIHLLTDCVVGERYYVRAYDGNGFSPFSRKYFIAVSSLPVTNLENGSCDASVTLSDQVTAETPEYQYQITDWVFEFTELETPFATFEFESPNGSNPSIDLLQVVELEAGRTYDVRVKGAIRNGQIFGDYGEACTISIVEGSGIGLIDGSADGQTEMDEITLELFPNPANGGEVSLSFTGLPPTERQILISVYDLIGKQVLFEQFSSGSESALFSLNIEDLTSGIYTVSTEVDGMITTKKLVVE